MMDRFCFLEILLSCKKTLCLSYHSDPQFPKKENMSVIFQELFNFTSQCLLLETIDVTSLKKKWIEQHPITPHSPSYYQSNSPLLSYQSKPFKTLSQAKKKDTEYTNKSIIPNEDTPTTKDISIENIRNLIKDPLKHFSHQYLKYYLPSSKENNEENEPLSLGNLSQYILSQGILSQNFLTEKIKKESIQQQLQFLIAKNKLPNHSSFQNFYTQNLYHHYLNIQQSLIKQIGKYSLETFYFNSFSDIPHNSPPITIESYNIFGSIPHLLFHQNHLYLLSFDKNVDPKKSTPKVLSNFAIRFIEASILRLSNLEVRDIFIYSVNINNPSLIEKRLYPLSIETSKKYLQNFIQYYQSSQLIPTLLYPDLVLDIHIKQKDNPSLPLKEIYHSYFKSQPNAFSSNSYSYSQYSQILGKKLEPISPNYDTLQKNYDQIYNPIFTTLETSL